jgi:hypothetical protein
MTCHRNPGPSDQILRAPPYIHYCVISAIPFQPVLGEEQGICDIWVDVLVCDAAEMPFTLTTERVMMKMIMWN